MKKRSSVAMVVGFLSISITSFACGPEYDYDSDLEVSLEFDPAKNESPYFTDVMRALGYEERYVSNEPKESYTAELNKISWSAGRNVEFVMTGKEYEPEALGARCPLMIQYDVSRAFDKLKYSKMIILEKSPHGGTIRYKHHDWDAVPKDKQKEKGFYTDWLAEKVRIGSTYCQFSQEYYPQIKERVGVREYVSPREDDLFEQLRGHPELSNYSSLVEAYVFIHENKFTAAKKLIAGVLEKSKDQFEIDVANALTEVKPAPSDGKMRYVIDDISSRIYSWGTCRSNTRENALVFIRNAANDKNLSDEGYRTVVGWRTAMLKLCNKADMPLELADSPDNTNPNVVYLRAVNAFNNGKYDEAAQQFSAAAKTSDAWVAETANYLVARSMLLAGQQNWYSHRPLPDANRTKLDSASANYAAYLKRYPEGLYADSARGMLRRINYLKGETKEYTNKLKAKISDAIMQWSSRTKFDMSDRDAFFMLVNEYRLRSGETTLQTFRMLNDVFNNTEIKNPELRDVVSEINYLLLAIDAYKNGDISFFEKNMSRKTRLQKFHGVISARAFEKAARYNEANEQWRVVKVLLEHPSDSDLSIAANIMRTGTLTDLLQSQYEIRDDIVSGYISAQCGEDSDQALLNTKLSKQMRAKVVQDLAMRKLTNADIAGLQDMYDVHSDAEMGELAMIRTAVRMVATGSNKGKGYMNIGYFLAKRGVPNVGTSIHAHYREKAKSGCNQVSGSDGSYTYFLKALDEFEGARNEDEAKTLHFLVMCSKSGSGRLQCWGSGKQQPSKMWFDKLHAKYPKSKWAKKTPYYYD